MPNKKEKQALRQAQQRKKQITNTLAIGVAGVAVIAIIVVLVIALSAAPIPASGLTLGNPDAPIKITEFADFQCPACSRFVLVVKPELVQKYIATGKVSLSFLPYSFIGPESYAAAQAAFCAADQEKFWDYYEYLFTNQGPSENDGTFSNANLNLFAERLGLDTELFSECLSQGKYEQAVLDANDTARSYGLDSTPSFIINGKVAGNQEQLIPAIEAILNEQ